jgi:AcrR family transcriptional regulator
METSVPNFRDQRRERIVDVARSVFFEAGYANATMSMISERLGGSKATLYAYFKSKEELFGAIIQDQCSFMQTMVQIPSPSDDLRTTLKKVGREVLKMVLSDQATRTHQLIIEETRRNPDLARQFDEIIESQARHGALKMLMDANEKGLIYTPDLDEAKRVFGSNLFGKLHMERVMGLRDAPTDAELDAQVELAVDVFITYYTRNLPNKA